MGIQCHPIYTWGAPQRLRGARRPGRAGEDVHSRVELIGGPISVDKPHDKAMVKAWFLPSDLLDSSIALHLSVHEH